MLLASLLGLFEFICWTINEVAGHHAQQQVKEASRPKRIGAPESAPAVENDDSEPDVSPIELMTVKQLRTLTGIRSSRYRKADLVAVAMGVKELQPL